MIDNLQFYTLYKKANIGCGLLWGQCTSLVIQDNWSTLAGSLLVKADHFVITGLCSLITIFFVFCTNSGGGITCHDGENNHRPVPPVPAGQFTLVKETHQTHQRVCSPIVLFHGLLSVKLTNFWWQSVQSDLVPPWWLYLTFMMFSCNWQHTNAQHVAMSLTSKKNLPSVPAVCFNLTQ